MITSTRAEFWLRFCLSVLVLVIFKSPIPNLVACFAVAVRQRFRIAKVSPRYRLSSWTIWRIFCWVDGIGSFEKSYESWWHSLENPQKSIIICTKGQNTRIRRIFVDFPKEGHQNSHGFSKFPIQCTRLRSLQLVLPGHTRIATFRCHTNRSVKLPSFRHFQDWLLTTNRERWWEKLSGLFWQGLCFQHFAGRWHRTIRIRIRIAAESQPNRTIQCH